MALVNFLIKQSESEPTLSDFFTELYGYFYNPWEVSSYIVNAADYNITSHGNNYWMLSFDSNFLRLITRLNISNKKIVSIFVEYVGLPLQEIYAEHNLLNKDEINSYLEFWSNTSFNSKYLYNIVFDFHSNLPDVYEYGALNQEYINILLSRGWLLTNEFVYPPDTTPSPTPTHTPTPTPTDIKFLSVLTIGGIGQQGNIDGVVRDVCSVPEYIPPTPTPSITSSRFIGLTVDTIAGGPLKRGSRDGESCLVLPPPPTPTRTPTVTPTVSPSQLHLLIVKTIGGTGQSGEYDGIAKGSCEIVPPTPTPTPFYGAKVITIAGKGSGGDLDGESCIPVTPTPSRSFGAPPIPSATCTPTPSRSFGAPPDPTPTVTPTITVTATPSNTPAATATPTNTPSPTNFLPGCVVVTPPIEEPCCKEPAVATGYGSTTFNSRVTSYAKLLNRIKSTLGYPLIQLEITDEQIFNAIDVSLELFTKFTGYTEEYLIFKSDLYKKGYGLPIGDLFSITPEMLDPNINPACRNLAGAVPGIDIDAGARRKVMSVFTVQPGDNSGINTLFTIEQTIAQQAYFGHLLGNVGFDLITFDVLKMWLKTREKVLALKPYFRFYPENQLLRITPEPEFRGTPYFGIIGAYVQKPIRELISQIWIYKYTMAQIKITMGHIRGKYAGTGVFGGQTVNYTDLMSQGLKEIDELEKELKTDLIDREPIPFFVG
jgi:hypothetical protein